MYAPIKQLIILQERDQKILALQKDLKSRPVLEQRARDRQKSDEQALQKAHDEAMQAEVALKKLQLETKTRRDTISKLKVQQYETRKNEEFRAIEHEVTRYEQIVSQYEDQELEVMVKIDTLKAAELEAKKKFAVTKQSVDEEIRTLALRAETSQTRLNELMEERKGLAAPVEEDLLLRYERLLKAKNGQAVSGISAGVCQGCHMKLTSATIFALKSQDSIVLCENCGRMLFYLD